MLAKSNNGLEDSEATVQNNILATAMDGLGEVKKKTASLAKTNIAEGSSFGWSFPFTSLKSNKMPGMTQQIVW